MKRIPLGALQEIIKDQRYLDPPDSIAVDVLLSRLGLTDMRPRSEDDELELERLRAIERLAKRLVRDPLWGVRPPRFEDADLLRKLVRAGTTDDGNRS